MKNATIGYLNCIVDNGRHIGSQNFAAIYDLKLEIVRAQLLFTTSHLHPYSLQHILLSPYLFLFTPLFPPTHLTISLPLLIYTLTPSKISYYFLTSSHLHPYSLQHILLYPYLLSFTPLFPPSHLTISLPLFIYTPIPSITSHYFLPSSHLHPYSLHHILLFPYLFSFTSLFPPTHLTISLPLLFYTLIPSITSYYFLTSLYSLSFLPYNTT